jgi:hypothetical protein
MGLAVDHVTNKEQGATMTQGQSESSAKYKVGDRVLYGRTQCEVAGVRVSVFGWTLYDLKASNGQVLGAVLGAQS